MFSNPNIKFFIGIDPGADGAVVVLDAFGTVVDKYTVPKKTVKSTKPAKDRDGKNKKDARGRLIYNDKKVMDEKAYFQVIHKVKNMYQPAAVILEKVKSIGSNPRQASVGATQNFNFGYNFGLINGFVLSCSFSEFHKVTPQDWQKEIIEESDKVIGTHGKNDNKASALKAFQRIFHKEDMRASTRSTLFHDGLVDAALLALWGLRMFVSEHTEEVF